MITGLLDRL